MSWCDLGDTEGAEQALAELGSKDRDQGETRIATAVLRLAQDDPHAAVAALAQVLEGGPSAQITAGCEELKTTRDLCAG